MMSFVCLVHVREMRNNTMGFRRAIAGADVDVKGVVPGDIVCIDRAEMCSGSGCL